MPSPFSTLSKSSIMKRKRQTCGRLKNINTTTCHPVDPKLTEIIYPPYNEETKQLPPGKDKKVLPKTGNK